MKTLQAYIDHAIQTAQNQLLDELVAEMPDELDKILEELQPQESYAGKITERNEAIDQLTKLIESKRSKL